MQPPENIVWLSSYPKSGNTWFRIVLSSLLSQSTSLNDINEMDKILGSPMVATRAWMNKALGFDSSLLTDDEIDMLRPATYAWYAQRLQQTSYIKIHDAYTYLDNDTPLIPAEGCMGAVYFIRNPLDVAISLAHHSNYPLDWSIHMMGDDQFTIPYLSSNDKQLRQKLLSWSGHVQSWTSAPNIKVLVLRYEDMVCNPLETFKKGLDFLHLPVSSAHLQQIIANTGFNKLQDHEKRFGFKETPAIKGQFFRKGIIGEWQETLTEAQIKKIIADHGEVMHAWGYADEEGHPLR